MSNMRAEPRQVCLRRMRAVEGEGELWERRPYGCLCGAHGMALGSMWAMELEAWMGWDGGSAVAVANGLPVCVCAQIQFVMIHKLVS